MHTTTLFLANISVDCYLMKDLGSVFAIRREKWHTPDSWKPLWKSGTYLIGFIFSGWQQWIQLSYGFWLGNQVTQGLPTTTSISGPKLAGHCRKNWRSTNVQQNNPFCATIHDDELSRSITDWKSHAYIIQYDILLALSSPIICSSGQGAFVCWTLEEEIQGLFSIFP
jgi:hypothetical protein